MSSENDTNRFVEITLDEACELITDGTHHSPPNGPNGEFRYVTAKNIKRGGLDLSATSFVTKIVHDDIYSRCPAKQADILFIKDGATAGIAAINTLEEPISLLSSVALLRPKFDLLDGQFLCHWLNSPEIIQRLAGEMTGSAIRRIILRDIRSAIIEIPPLPEQRRIVAKLDALQARTRIAREALDAVAPLLKSFHQSVLQAAVTGALTEEWRSKQKTHPEWEDCLLGDVIKDIRYGTSAKCRYQPVAMPVLRIPNIGEGVIRLGDIKYGAFDEIERGKLALEAGDILVIRSNGSADLVGKPALVSEHEAGYLFAGYLIRLRFQRVRIAPEYALHAISSPQVRDWIESETKSSSGVNNISAEKLRCIPLSLPPLPEQTEIVRRVQHLFAMADAMEAEFAAAQRSVDQLDQSLLATAFRGELVPQDPSDEPASVLLERIRAAHAALPEAKTKRGRRSSSEFDARLLMAAKSATPKKRGRPRKV